MAGRLSQVAGGVGSALVLVVSGGLYLVFGCFFVFDSFRAVCVSGGSGFVWLCFRAVARGAGWLGVWGYGIARGC
jgi:hypothetical protein